MTSWRDKEERDSRNCEVRKRVCLYNLKTNYLNLFQKCLRKTTPRKDKGT